MLLKILYDLWPFIKEIFAGESDISKAVRRNKLTTLLFIVNICLFCLSIYMTDQMITKQKESKATIQEVTKLRTDLEACQKQKNKVCPVIRYIPPPPVNKPREQTNNPEPETPTLQNKLDALRREEN